MVLTSSSSKRIGLDLMPLYERLTGIGVYVKHLVNAMLVSGSADYRYLFPILSSLGERRVATQLRRHLPNSNIGICHGWRPGVEIWFRLGGRASCQRLTGPLDLFHIMGAHIWFQFEKIPTVMTVHDLAWHHLPGAVCARPPRIRPELLAATIRAARVIICVSQATCNDVQEHFGIAADRLVVAPLAARPEFLPPSDDDCRRAARQKHTAGSRYFLAVSTIEPRKNYPRLIQAYANVRRSGLEHRLVIVGRRGWDWKEVLQTIHRTGVEAHVDLKNYVSDSTLQELYWGADALVMPSLYEGFGLPVVEAMHCGTPVVAANTGSLPEVAGDAALMVDPLNIDTIEDALLRVAMRPELAADLIQRGYRQAERFNWRTTAERTWHAYRLALS